MQASFYAYGERDELYELYLVFPEGVQSGTTVSDPADGENTAIFLYVTEVDGSGSLAVASQASGMPYPEGSSYSIYFGEVVQTGSARTFSGAFDATLVALDDAFNATSATETVSGAFSFTMDFDSLATDDGGLPSSGLVTPPDAQKI